MEYGLIKDTTMTAIADSLRSTGYIPMGEEIPIEYVDVFKYKTANATSLDDPTPTSWGTEEIIPISIPEATSLEIVMHYGQADMTSSNVQGTLSFSTIDDWALTGGTFYISNSATSETFKPNINAVKVRYRTHSVATAPCAVTFEVYPLDASGNRMRIVTKSEIIINKVTPSEIVEAVGKLTAPIPEEAFKITGNLNYRFNGGSWDWFIANYSNKITSEDINSLGSSFTQSKVTEIPFILNINKCSYLSDCFKNMSLLEKSPIVRGSLNMTTNLNLGAFVEGCDRVRDFEDLFTNDMLKDFNTIKCTSAYSCAKPVTFRSCGSLRQIPSWWYQFRLCEDSTAYPSYSYSPYYNGFGWCYSLDEVLDMPVWKCQSAQTSNMFSTSFNWATRLKDITFETIDGQPIETKWKSQVIDLSANIGWASGGADVSIKDRSAYSGITEDKKVIDDFSYQALKNDPDWYSALEAYSRYDHDSAVRTINSLPDTSAYLASAGGTNTIKFKKTAGSKTDGGAIENLTAEEIAVAAAKGWTVTLV